MSGKKTPAYKFSATFFEIRNTEDLEAKTDFLLRVAYQAHEGLVYYDFLSAVQSNVESNTFQFIKLTQFLIYNVLLLKVESILQKNTDLYYSLVINYKVADVISPSNFFP